MRQTVVALALTIAVASPLAAQTAPDFSEVRRILREGMARESAPAAARPAFIPALDVDRNSFYLS